VSGTPVSSMLLVFVASIIGSFGAVMLKLGAGELNKGFWHILNVKLASGVALFLASSYFFVAGIRHGELSVLYPMVSLGYIWTLLWARLVFKEAFTRQKFLGLALILLGVFFVGLGSQPAGKIAPKPLFRDPVHDGAADPALVWNRGEKKWFMFYTNRRADLRAEPGVAWVHGTRIGIAESADGGATWKYRGTAEIAYGQPDYTHWAPDVIDDGTKYHMYLSVVPGIFHDWNAPRAIVHLTSDNLLQWTYQSTLPLASDRVIDASLCQLGTGTWRLWYKNERDGSHIYYADSPDLYQWKQAGVAITDRAGEGPKIFRWKNRYWMITDMWNGLAVYSSGDAEKWTPQPEPLLQEAGQAPTDRGQGHHVDVVVSGGRAFLFYFVHQGGADLVPGDRLSERRTAIQVVELQYQDGRLGCDRNQPTRVLLQPPAGAAGK